MKQLLHNKHKAFRAISGLYKGKSCQSWNELLKLEIKLSKSTILERALGDDKCFWRTVRQTIGLASDSSLPSSVTANAQELFSTSNVAEAFSMLYQSKWQPDPQPLPHHAHAGAPKLSVHAVKKLLMKSKQRNTSGPDNLPAWFFSTYSSEIALPVTVLFNAVLSSSRSPIQWRTQRVTPVPKISNPSALKDFRPIAISSSFGKILERFVRDRLALELGIDFDTAQFGFRKESSCTTALIHMMHHWLQALDRGNDVRAVCLDFSAAFDRLPHKIIISKLVSFGVSDWIVAYVTDFLSGRSQFVCSPDNSFSDTVKVRSGVPQGSIIAPLLFAVAAHDLPAVNGCNITKYADDSTVWRVIDSTAANADLQACLDQIAQWCDDNYMLLNPLKSVELHLTNRRNVPHLNPIRCKDIEVPRVKSSKLLGVVFTDNLSFSEHIASICTSATKTLFFLRRLKLAGASPEDLVRVYSSYTRPLLEFASPLWGSCITNTDDQKLESLQRRALRICGTDLSVIPTLKSRRTAAATKLFCAAVSSKSHSLSKIIPGKVNSHGRQTRSAAAGHLVIPHARTAKFKNSFIVQCARNFNALL